MQAMADRGFGFYQATVYKVESNQRRVTVGEAIALAQIVRSTVERLAGGLSVADGDEDGERAIIREYLRTLEETAARIEVQKREAEASLAERAHLLRQLEESQAKTAALVAETQDLLRGLADGEHQTEA